MFTLRTFFVLISQKKIEKVASLPIKKLTTSKGIAFSGWEFFSGILLFFFFLKVQISKYYVFLMTCVYFCHNLKYIKRDEVPSHPKLTVLIRGQLQLRHKSACTPYQWAGSGAFSSFHNRNKLACLHFPGPVVV